MPGASMPAFMSPPDGKLFDSFELLGTSSSQMASSSTRCGSGPNGRSDHLEQPLLTNVAAEPPSPPASPWDTQRKNNVGLCDTAALDATEQGSEDPPLYSGEEVASLEDSLFHGPGKLAVDAWERDIAYHFVEPKSRGYRRKKRFQWPTKEELSWMLSVSSVLCGSYNRNPGVYLKNAREEMERARLARWPRQNKTAEMLNRDSKPFSPTSRRSHHQPAKGPPKGKVSPLRKERNANGGLTNSTVDRIRAPHTRASSIKRPEDINFEALTDFSPPTTTLPNNNKALKIEWSSHNPLDLSTDPHRHLLHEAEIALASTLRLSCATYLCSKRRIFMRVRDAYALEKEFRKTDAQQACQIDVNKASKLWVAYEKVGWFKRDHFERYLDR